MKRSEDRNSRRNGRAKPEQHRDEKYVLRLYVSGVTAKSTRAIINLKALCEKHLHGRFKLDVVDIYQQPELAKDKQIVAAPTLIKSLPLPLRRFIGDMSRPDRVLLGLGVAENKPFEKKEENDEDNAPIGHTPRF